MRTLIVICALFLQANIASARVKYLNDVVPFDHKGRPVDIAKAIKDIQLTPTKDVVTGSQVYKVKSVASGSAYEMSGIKAGDLVVKANAPKPRFQKVGAQKDKAANAVSDKSDESPAKVTK